MGRWNQVDRGPVDRRTGTGSRLFAIYALVSLIPVAILGGVVNQLVRHEIDDRALSEAVARAQTISDASIEPAIGSGALDHGISSAQRRRLIASTASLHGDASVLRLRLRSATGTILFDASHPHDAPKVAVDDEVKQAAAGVPVRALTRMNNDEVDLANRSGADVAAVETYVAVHPPGSSRVVAVLETYLPYQPFADTAAASERRLTEALVGGLGILWMILALVSWSVTRKLRATAEESAWLAHSDQLTGLPNRHAFSEMIEAWADADHPILVGVVDIARFREVNETIGHDNGDRFLCDVARRLSAGVDPVGMVARVGGDQFAVLWPDFGAGGESRMLAAIQSATAEQVSVAGIRVNLEVTVGVASSTQITGDAADLLRCADLATHAAKEARLIVVGYTPELETFDPDRLELAGELGEAIAAGQLKLHYQPKLNLITGHVRSVEALVRWEHPERGLLPPADFVPLAETTSLIRPLTAWVVEEAARQIVSWRHDHPALSVSINFSARNLDDNRLAEHLLQVLAAARVPASRLEVEITETAAIADPTRAKDLLGHLRQAGVRISLDDFGQGSTSLVSLTDLPVDELKIDRSFVLGLEKSDAKRAVAEFVIALGHRLGMLVVAEGIETENAATLLTSMGCDEGQGYLFCHPMPADELERWLVDHQHMLSEVASRSDATADAPVVVEPALGSLEVERPTDPLA